MASYYCDDVMGARMLIEDATQLREAKRSWRARTKLQHAIKLLEKLAPDSPEMTEAYRDMCWTYWFARHRKHNVGKRRLEALAWYEKALAVSERRGDIRLLGGDCVNISLL